MWDFSQYTSREQAFNGFFQGSLNAAKAEARARIGAQAFKTALKIHYKLFLEYLKTSVAAVGDFGPRSLAGYLKNFDLRDREESRRATEGRSW